ncbi:tyrosine-type recombinase/integrase, partial [Klebsiella pneumoniae]
TVCVVGKMRDLILQLSKSSIYSTKPAGDYRYVFPGRNDPNKPMSEASINQVIKRIGFGGNVTGHGFRHTLSSVLHEQGYESAWIETQLAHVDKNSILGTYNHAVYLDKRRSMLQWYADNFF